MDEGMMAKLLQSLYAWLCPIHIPFWFLGDIEHFEWRLRIDGGAFWTARMGRPVILSADWQWDYIFTGHWTGIQQYRIIGLKRMQLEYIYRSSLGHLVRWHSVLPGWEFA